LLSVVVIGGIGRLVGLGLLADPFVGRGSYEMTSFKEVEFVLFKMGLGLVVRCLSLIHMGLRLSIHMKYMAQANVKVVIRKDRNVMSRIVISIEAGVSRYGIWGKIGP
jgi:hypothetical protein